MLAWRAASSWCLSRQSGVTTRCRAPSAPASSLLLPVRGGSAAPFLKGRLTNSSPAIVLETATTQASQWRALSWRNPGVGSLLHIRHDPATLAYQMLAKRRDPAPRADTAFDRPLDDAASAIRVTRIAHSAATNRLSGGAPADGHDVDVRCRPDLGAFWVSGSGVLKVPAMDTALRLPIKVSSATSNFMICVTAAASAGAYFVRGDSSCSDRWSSRLGSVVGAILGARFSSCPFQTTEFAGCL